MITLSERSARIDGRIKAAWAWMLANPKPTLISIAVALAFNFVLYPLAREAGNNSYRNNCDDQRTSTAVVLCHLEYGKTFVGSFL
jgi:hypothetical protein